LRLNLFVFFLTSTITKFSYQSKHGRIENKTHPFQHTNRTRNSATLWLCKLWKNNKLATQQKYKLFFAR